MHHESLELLCDIQHSPWNTQKKHARNAHKEHGKLFPGGILDISYAEQA